MDVATFVLLQILFLQRYDFAAGQGQSVTPMTDAITTTPPIDTTPQPTCGDTDSLFVEQSIPQGEVPVGCHSYVIYTCPGGKQLKLLATDKWYRNPATGDVYTLPGVAVFIQRDELLLPVSTNGAYVFTSFFSFTSMGQQLPGEDQEVVSTEESNGQCSSFTPCPNHPFQYESAGSFLRTFLKQISETFVNWATLSETSTANQDLDVSLLFGEALLSAQCEISQSYQSHLYVVFKFNADLQLTIYGQSDTVPQTSQRFCLVIDMCEGGTAYLIIPPDTDTAFNNNAIFNNINQNTISPYAIGFSITDNITISPGQIINSGRRKRSTEQGQVVRFWNGHSLYEQDIPSAFNFYIRGEFTKTTDIFDIKANVEIFASVPSINQIYTGLYIDEWSVYTLLDLSETSELKYRLFGQDRTIALKNVVSASLSAYSSIGATDGRDWCGPTARPPGIYISALIKSNPFPDVQELANWEIDLEQRFYAYFTTPINSRLSESVQINIASTILDLLALIGEKKAFIEAILSLTTNIKSHLEAIANKYTDMETAINENINEVSNGKPENMKQFIDKLWNDFKQTESVVYEMVGEAEFSEKQEDKAFSEVIVSDTSEIGEKLGTAVRGFSEQVLTNVEKYTNFGFKFTATISLFGLEFPVIDADFVYSTTTDNQFCDKYQSIDQLIPNENSAGLLGTFSLDLLLGSFLKVYEGFEIQSAFAINSDDFQLKFSPNFTFLGIRERADVSIDRVGLSSSMESLIWNLFPATLGISATHGTSWSQLKYDIDGQFVADALSSFQSSFLKELRNVADTYTDDINRRVELPEKSLSDAKEELLAAERLLNASQDTVVAAQEGLSRAELSLANAEAAVAAAKGPYDLALAELIAAEKNVNNLCIISECDVFCIGKFKCKTCVTFILTIKFQYSCCFRECKRFHIDYECAAKNAVCMKVREMAFKELVEGQQNLADSIEEYDAKTKQRDIAKQIVFNARGLLGLSEKVRDFAEIGFIASQNIVNGAAEALTIVKQLLGPKVNVAQYVKNVGSESTAEVGNSNFNIEILTEDMPVFDVTSAVNAFRLGSKPILMRLNFNHIMQTMLQAAIKVIDILSPELSNSVRKKRENSEVRNGIQPRTRFNRQVDETIDIRNEIIGFVGNITTDYDNRVSIYSHKCTTVRIFNSFLQESFNLLFSVANESVSLIDTVLTDNERLNTLNVSSLAENLTLDTVGIDTQFATNTFNISLSSLNDALQEAKAEISSDPLIEEINKSVQDANLDIGKELELAQSFQLIPQWISAMENVSDNYFNETQCTKFEDCIRYTVSEYFKLLTNEDIPNHDNILGVVKALDDSISKLFQNVSVDLHSTYNQSVTIRSSLDELASINPFCAKAPTLTIEPQGASLFEGETLILTCQAEGDPRPTYQWEKDGDSLGVTINRFVVANVGVADSGSYRCIATNYVASISSRIAFIKVTVPTTTAPATTTTTPSTNATSETTPITNATSETTPITNVTSETTPITNATSETTQNDTTPSITPTQTSATDGTTTASKVSGDFPVIPVVVPVTIGVIAILLVLAAIIVRYLRKPSGSRRSNIPDSSFGGTFWRPGLRFQKEELLAPSFDNDDLSSNASSRKFNRWNTPFGWE